MNTPSTEVRERPPKFSFEATGTGIMRSTGQLIVLLLSLEDEFMRAGILIDAAKELGIPLDELIDEYKLEVCAKCHNPMMHHKHLGGMCP